MRQFCDKGGIKVASRTDLPRATEKKVWRKRERFQGKVLWTLLCWTSKSKNYYVIEDDGCCKGKRNQMLTLGEEYRKVLHFGSMLVLMDARDDVYEVPILTNAWCKKRMADIMMMAQYLRGLVASSRETSRITASSKHK
jgi:hypothetical protein